VEAIMQRPYLMELALAGVPLRFAASPESAALIAVALGEWAAYLAAAELDAGIDPNAGLHDQVVQFMASVGRVAPPHPAASKCREYYDYFLEKCAEQGTAPESWRAGIRFARPGRDGQQVIANVVRETIDHVLTLEREARPARSKEVPDSPIDFVASEDDSRKPRGYFYYGNDRAMVETHFDAHLLLDLQDLSLTPTILKTGWWEPWIDILLRSILRPGMTYANAGANVGYHAALGGKLVGSEGKVFAFEANPHAYELLRKSVYFNGFSGRTALFAAGVYDEAGEREIHYVREMLDGGGIYAPDTPPAERPVDGLHELRERFLYTPADYTIARVPVVTIDEAVGAERATIDVLHMDIEGSEGPALLGARKLISRSRRLAMIVDWSLSGVKSVTSREKFARALDFLVAEGFRFHVITPPEGNVYTTPPVLRAVAASELPTLGPCDLFMTR
jgi:FkbM family methyltransferase